MDDRPQFACGLILCGHPVNHTVMYTAFDDRLQAQQQQQTHTASSASQYLQWIYIVLDTLLKRSHELI